MERGGRAEVVWVSAWLAAAGATLAALVLDMHAGILLGMSAMAIIAGADFLKHPERFVNIAIIYLVGNVVLGYLGDIHTRQEQTPFLIFQFGGFVALFRRPPLRLVWRLFERGTTGKSDAITIALSVGVMLFASLMWYFYLKHGNIPMLAEDPSLARFQAFEGQSAELGLTRFFFRIGFEVTAILLGVVMVMGIWTRLSAEATVCRFLAIAYGAAPLLLSGTRSGLLTPLAAWAYAMMLDMKRQGRPIAMKTAVTGLAVAGLFVGLGKWRDAQMTPGSLSRQDRLYIVAPSFRDGLTVWEKTKEVKSYNWGLSYLSDMLCFIPSSKFTFRQEYDWSRRDLRLLGYEEKWAARMGGIAQTMFVAYYQSWGYVGVVLGIGAWAWCVVAMERWIASKAPPLAVGGIVIAGVLLSRSIRSKGFPFVQLWIVVGAVVAAAIGAGLFLRARGWARSARRAPAGSALTRE